MSATQIIGQNISRRGWGVILLAAAVFAVSAALLLEALGLGSDSLGPVSFVSAVVMVKLGLFSFWPVIAAKGAEASTVIHTAWRRSVFDVPKRGKSSRSSSIQLWNERDSRIDVVCFDANVPSFILNHEQCFLEWNRAFDLIFGHLPGMRRGAHVRIWYKHLDNFRRVAKRTEKLYGEGILPITDRERISFVSSVFGRMVFTRIMTPIIDRESARIVGWNVVLNINSVNKREAFFERLFATIAAEIRCLRHTAGIDGLFERFPAYKKLLKLHANLLRQSDHVLELGAQTGNLTLQLLQQGHKVTAVDASTQQLRKLRSKCDKYSDELRIVRRDPADISKLPEARFSAAVMMLALHKFEDPTAMLKQIYRSLVPGGLFAVSFILPGAGLEGFFDSLRKSLERAGHFDALKHQLNHVLEFERELAVATPFRFHSREDVRAYLIEAGFRIESEYFDLLDGKVELLVARKDGPFEAISSWS